MSRLNVIRAWKDAEYRLSLSDAEHAQLPAHPAGILELTDDDLGAIAGGLFPEQDDPILHTIRDGCD